MPFWSMPSDQLFDGDHLLRIGLLSTRSTCQSQHGVSGGRVAHEESGVGQHRPVVVKRNRRPPAIRLNLVPAQPRERPLQPHLSLRRFEMALFPLRNPITEANHRTFRAECFNLTNTPQFAPPNTSLGAAGFGAVSAQNNQPRILQLALKLLY
jgi:hypothetical protein